MTKFTGGITMSVQVENSWEIDRPVEKVFQFMAVDHVQNHPRWDPDIELWHTSDEPIGVGTIISRRSTRNGKSVEGTVEVTRFEPNKVMAVVIREGGMEVLGETSFEASGDHSTKITTIVELPGMDEAMDTSALAKALQRSAENQKSLMLEEVS